MAIRGIMFAMFVVASIAVMGNLSGISAECGGDLQTILNTCGPFLKKEGPEIPPNQPCCGVLENVDILCLCGYITPPIEAEISVEKAIYVARQCGCVIPPAGTKCGSYTIPPPPPGSPPISK